MLWAVTKPLHEEEWLLGAGFLGEDCVHLIHQIKFLFIRSSLIIHQIKFDHSSDQV